MGKNQDTMATYPFQRIKGRKMQNFCFLNVFNTNTVSLSCKAKAFLIGFRNVDDS